MDNTADDPDVAALAAITARLEADYASTAAQWQGSPFAWIKTHPSRQVGKIGEQIVSAWCESLGLSVAHSPDSEADRVIAGRRVEIKFSTLWQSGGYTFQQIRDQNYATVICLGISPFGAHCWVIPKAIIRRHATPQHGGKTGTDTLWLSFPAAMPPGWMAPYGGTLAAAAMILRRW